MSLPPFAILAGGAATRLGPLTRQVPKSLVSVAGEPFITHQLGIARRRGLRKVVLLIGHLGDQVRDFVGDGTRFGLDVEYSSDGAEPKGTGGAVYGALPLLGQLFFVIYGDSYLDVPLEPLLEARLGSGCPAVMAVFHNRDHWGTSNVVFDGQKVRLHDKAAAGQPRVEWIDYGLSLFESTVFEEMGAEGAFDLSTLTGALAKKGCLAGVEITERFYEIGRPSGLSETEEHLLSACFTR